ncbi:MAG: FapA family protein [Fidelibacterota bacterium]
MGNSAIQVKLSEDGRVGLLTISAPPESYPSLTEIYSAITAKNWPLKINRPLLEKLVHDHQSTRDQIITEIDFEDHSFIWYVELPTQLIRARHEEGRVDFKKILEFKKVSEGQKLCSVLPPDSEHGSGAPIGRTILHYLAGHQTTISDDGLTLYAQKDGYVFIHDNKIIVDNVYSIEGDVDFKTGNVKFEGVILIEGDVRSGFRVDASESIIINGMVEAASIYSRAGDITIKCGIMGQNRAKVLAGGSVKCSFVQNASISARKDVAITKYALDSNIQSGGKIFVNTEEGLIRGGKVLAQDEIFVNTVGNERGAETEIGLTGFENESIDSRRKSLKDEQMNLRTRLSSLEKQVEFFNLLKERLDGLTSQKEEERVRALADIKRIQAELATLETRLAALDKKDMHAHRLKCISVFGTVYPGVTISLGSLNEYIGSPEKRVRYYRHGNQIGRERIE